ncbi:MAG: hypothetical protein ACOYO1_19060 [Bacteroidales bacterium]
MYSQKIIQLVNDSSIGVSDIYIKDSLTLKHSIVECNFLFLSCAVNMLPKEKRDMFGDIMIDFKNHIDITIINEIKKNGYDNLDHFLYERFRFYTIDIENTFKNKSYIPYGTTNFIYSAPLKYYNLNELLDQSIGLARGEYFLGFPIIQQFMAIFSQRLNNMRTKIITF